MGGLLAVDKGIAHFAGCHLLDPETGEYNLPYIARFVKNRPVTVVTVVHRWQGLMVCKANPKGIQSVRDLRATRRQIHQPAGRFRDARAARLRAVPGADRR